MRVVTPIEMARIFLTPYPFNPGTLCTMRTTRML